MNVGASIDAIERRIAALEAAPAHDGAFAALLSGGERQPIGARAPIGNARLDALIAHNAARFGVDPALVGAVVACESGGDCAATSATGAAGLMQLMPATAASLGVRDPYDAAQNIAGGTRYLRTLLDRFGGDVRRAVAAYNAGPGAVERWDGVPPCAQTQRYVVDVLSEFARRRGA